MTDALLLICVLGVIAVALLVDLAALLVVMTKLTGADFTAPERTQNFRR